MTLQEAFNFFENLKTNTANKSEIKIYNNFLDILTKLKTREFSKEEIQSIERKLDSLDIEANLDNKKKYFSKKLKEFKKYLKENHSLFPAGYYTNVGLSMGVAFGVVAGVIFGERFEKSLGLAVGISIGMLIGLYVGRHMDAKEVAEGHVI